MGSVSGQFRFAGRFDPIEPKSFGLIRKFRCGMSIQMAYFQARDFDRNRVAVVGGCWFGSQDCRFGVSVQAPRVDLLKLRLADMPKVC
jgi:hypothetical protein